MQSRPYRNTPLSRTQKVHIAFRPTKEQQDVGKAIAGGAKVVLCLGGVQSGKSTVAMAEVLKQHYTYGCNPPLIWVVSPTYPMSLAPERLFRNFVTGVDSSLIAHERKSERAIILRPSKQRPNVFCRVEFKSAEDPDKLRAATVGAVVLDEGAMMPREVFTIMQGRVLAAGGMILIPTTPMGRNWVYDIYLRSLEDPRYKTIRMPTISNIHLSAEAVEAIYKDYGGRGSSRARQELEGLFQSFEGRVFPTFDTGTHVRSGLSVPDGVPVYCGIDWGYNEPFVCVWAAKWDGLWHVLDEYYIREQLLSDLSGHIRSHPLAHRVKTYWSDPSRIQERKEFQKLGIPVLPARRPAGGRYSWPVARAHLMNSMLNARARAPWSGKEEPILTLSNSCTHGIREFLTLPYKRTGEVLKDGTYRSVDAKGREVAAKNMEEIAEDQNHFVDALGYCIWSEHRSMVQSNIVPPIPTKPLTQAEIHHLEFAKKFKDADKRMGVDKMWQKYY